MPSTTVQTENSSNATTAAPPLPVTPVKAATPVAKPVTLKRKKATVTAPAAPTAPAPRKKTAATPAVPVKAAGKSLKKAKAAAPATTVVPVQKHVASKASAEKLSKTKKPKLVRDSFTIPKAEYAVLESLKQRAIQLAQPAKKSELLRAGIKALASMSDAALRAALDAVPAIKTGRPANPVATPAKKI